MCGRFRTSPQLFGDGYVVVSIDQTEIGDLCHLSQGLRNIFPKKKAILRGVSVEI